MTRFKYVYWCFSHQQHVAPKALQKLRDQLRCKIVKLNLTLLGEVDFHKFSTWINSELGMAAPPMRSPVDDKIASTQKQVCPICGSIYAFETGRDSPCGHVRYDGTIAP